MSDYRLNSICTEGIPLFPKCCYSENFNTNFDMQFHRHNTIEIMYAQNKEFIVELFEGAPNSRQQVKKIFVPSKHYVLINSNVFHRLVIKSQETLIFNVEFLIEPRTPFSAILSELYNQSTEFRNFIQTDRDIYVLKSHKSDFQIFNKMQQELFSLPIMEENTDYFSEEFVTEYLNLQHYTFLFFLHTSKNFFSGSDKGNSKYINETIQYINQYLYDEKLSTKTIAEHLHLNVSYLSSYFKKHTNMNISSYINKKRIIQAMHLLSTTSMPVNQIGIQVGFNNRQHFARIFKTVAKCSPIEYRKATQQDTLKNYVEDSAYPSEKFSFD